MRKLIHTLARRHEAPLAREAQAIAIAKEDAAARTAAASSPALRTAARRRARVHLARRRVRLTKGRLSLAGALAVGLAVGTGVFGYWTVGGSGNASAAAADLDAPANVVASHTVGSGTVGIEWDGVLGPDAGPLDGYYVTRDNGSTLAGACGSSPSALLSVSPTECDDLSVPDGTYTYTVTAVFRSWSAESGASNSVTVVNDADPPGVESITRDDPSPTNAAGVSWTVTFDEDVTGVGVADFAVVGPGATGASISSVSPSAGPEDEYVVEVSTGSDGNLGLNVVDDNSIKDAALNPLGGAGAGDGNVTGPVYVIDKSGPTNVLSLLAQTPTGSSYYFGAGNIVFYRGSGGGAGGTFKLRNALTDAGTGPASSATSTLAGTTTGWSHTPSTVSTPSGGPYDSNSFDWTEGTSSQPTELVMGTDALGNTTALTLTFKDDSVAPAAGSLTVNAVAGDGAGTTSTNFSGSFPINVRTNYSEAQNATASGLASSILERRAAPFVNNVCGAFGAPSTITGTPTQDAGAGIASGNCYRYTLTGTDNVGNAVSIQTTVRVDTSPPAFGSPALTLADSGDFAHYPGTGTTVYYNGVTGTASSITVNAPNVADPESAIQKVNFPTLGAGFSGGGDDLASPYGTTYTWSASIDSGSKSVTATNNVSNTSTSPFTLVRDVIAPGGGALTVNGQAASGAGTTSNSTTGNFTIGRTDYSEAQNATQSGLLSSTLVREQATLSGNSCGGFGSPVTIAGNPAQSVASGNCYRYTLTGTDNVGNSVSIQTTVKVDSSAPNFGSPALTIGENGPFAHYPGSGTIVYYNGASGAGSNITVDAPNVADPETGIQSVTFPSPAGFTGGSVDTTSPYGTTYTWSTSAANGNQTVTAANGFGTTTNTTFTLARDVTAPTGGALTVNGGSPASSGGTTSYSTTGTFTGTRTNYAETQTAAASGLATSTLVRTEAPYVPGTGNCGTFGSPTTVVGTPSETTLADGCYRYTLTGTDNVGNTLAILTTVIVDKVAPTATNVQLTGNGGSTTQGDSVVVTFSEDMNATTFCGTWSNGAGTQTLNGNGQVVVTITNSGANDVLTVSTSSGCSITFGSVALGADYVTTTKTYSGNGSNASVFSWNPSAGTLTITLGNPNNMTGINPGVLAQIPSYTANTALRDRAGNAIGAGPYAGTSSRF